MEEMRLVRGLGRLGGGEVELLGDVELVGEMEVVGEGDIGWGE